MSAVRNLGDSQEEVVRVEWRVPELKPEELGESGWVSGEVRAEGPREHVRLDSVEM